MRTSKSKSYEYGGDFESPRIYIVNLEAYNNNIDEGVWLDFSDYKNADELMNDIQNWLDEWGVEEYQIIDGEYLPAPMGMDVSDLRKANFEEIYTLMDVAKEKGISIDDAYEEMYGENESFADGGKIVGDESLPKAKFLQNVLYKNRIWEVTQQDGKVGLISEGFAFEESYDFIPISKINVEEVTDMRKNKLKFPLTADGFDNAKFDSFANGGTLNWQKYPTKKVRGLYDIKGDGINRKVNIVFFERYDDELYSLYPLDKDKHLFKEIMVKSTALNSLDKGVSVQGETNDGKKVSIKRISNQDFSYAKGGGLDSHGIKQGDTFLKTISGGIQKVKDKNGNIFYINLATGERHTQPPLPFAKGGDVKEEEVTYFVNKDGIRVRSKVEPKEKLSEAEWMAKHNDSKEARSYAFGGFFGKSNMESKPKKINLNDKQVRLNSGEYVQVLDQDGDTLMVMELSKIGTGASPKMVKISDVDMTSFATGGSVDVKKGAIKVGVFSSEDLKNDVFLKAWEKKSKETGFTNIDLKTINRGGKTFIEFYLIPDKTDSDVKIKDWYMKNYPTDDLGKELNDEVTFEDMWNEDYKKYDIYEVMGVGDSLIRERLFEHLAEIKGVTYDVVYRKLFSTDGFYENGGKVFYKDLFNDYKNQPEELKEIVDFYETKWEKADYNYKDSFNFQKEVETIGYTFNYGLDNEPFALRKKDVKLNQVLGYENMDIKNNLIFANGGSLIGNQKRIDMNHNGKIDAEDFEIMRNTMDGAWRKDRKYVNSTSRKDGKLVDYEVRYARKNNPSRKGYKGKIFAKGGEVYNDSKYLTKEQWEKWNDYVKTGKINGKKVDNMFTVARHIGVPVAKINSYNIEQRKKSNAFADGGSLKKIKLKDLVNKRFDIEIGSMSASGDWEDEDEIIKYISDAIKHNLFDSEFYYNWTDDKKEYLEIFKNDTLEPLLKNIDKTLNDLFVFEEKPYPYGNKLKFKMNNDEKENWIDNWFKTNKSISQSLKKDYYNYRDEYAGVKLLKGGGFEKLSNRVAKNYEGKRVKPQYQKEYGKVYSKEEAKEVGNKVAGKVKANQKMSTGGETKKGARGGIMTLAKKIRKDGEKWTDAVKRAGQQLK